jgi:hypothetical protein
MEYTGDCAITYAVCVDLMILGVTIAYSTTVALNMPGDIHDVTVTARCVLFHQEA